MVKTSYFNIENTFELNKTTLPTNDEVLRYYFSRPNEKSATKTWQLSDKIFQIWNEADCSPKTAINIREDVSKLVLQWKKYIKPKSHQKMKPRSRTPVPVRKSTRRSEMSPHTLVDEAQSPQTPVEEAQSPQTSVEEAQSPQTSVEEAQSPQTSVDPKPVEEIPGVEKSQSHKDTTSSRATRTAEKAKLDEHKMWMKECGSRLFDVFSEQRMNKIITSTGSSEGFAFDSEFYEDQKDPQKRKLVMQRMKVTREYYEQVKQNDILKARKYQRQKSQYSNLQSIPTESEDTTDNSDTTAPGLRGRKAKRSLNDTELQDQDVFTPDKIMKYDSKSDISSPEVICPILTKSTSEVKLQNVHKKVNYRSFGVQVNDERFPKLSTRVGDSRAVKPSILQSLVLMCAVGNESPSQAVLNLSIIGKEVFNQYHWNLPLTLQKKYQAKLTLAKRLQSKFPNDPNKVIEDVNTLDPEAPPPDDKTTQLLKEANEYINDVKEFQKNNISSVLPDPRTVRSAEHVVSTFVEGKVAKEMMDAENTFSMPDGTSRAKVGKYTETLMIVNGKQRALRMQKIAAETTDNLADTIIHQLTRVVTASELPLTIEQIYKAIKAMISDKCSVNMGLVQSISAKIGLEYVPGHFTCCLHSVLGFGKGIVQVWFKYQARIGYSKMYPSATGLDLDMEDKCLPKQQLEAYTKLTADKWHARMWNRFEEFCAFAAERGAKNLARQLHGSRFGDLEHICAIGVYSLPLWDEFVCSYANTRNTLAVFLRDCQQISEMSRFLWLGGALIGIHLTEPYMSYLLDLKATHLDLLVTLKQVYHSLNTYSTPFSQIEKPAIPSLQQAWVNPLSAKSPYGKDIGAAIQETLNTTDTDMLDRYMKQLCKEMAVVLKRQRGAAYGFADVESEVTEEESEEWVDELVTKQVTSEDILKAAPTHTKAVENFFGTSGAVLERFGPQAFNKAADDMVIKYSQDLIGKPEEWCTKAMRRKTRKVDSLQKKFGEKQKNLATSRIVPAEVAVIQQNAKVLRAVENCRKHGGPVASEDEMDRVLGDMQKKSEADVRRFLTAEIRYRKVTSLNIKISNPLFSQIRIKEETKIHNLRMLIRKSETALAATATMSDLSTAIIEEGGEDTECTGDEAEESGDKAEESGDKSEEIEDEGEESGDKGEESVVQELKRNEMVAVNLDDGFWLGEVLEITTTTVKISFM